MTSFGSTLWKAKEEPIKDKIISDIEKQWGIKFPDLYFKCVQIYHGGYPLDQAFDFDGHKEAVFNRFLSYNPTNKMFILKVYNQVEQRLVEGVFPFATDPFGNLICFDYRDQNNEEPKIVFWDHEESTNFSLSIICDTFNEFLSKLYTPEAFKK